MDNFKNIGKPMYGLLDNGLFGFRIIAGIVTGIRFTENKPMYEISFGNDKWWTSEISDIPEKLFQSLNLTTLDRIKQTHNLKIKFQ